MAFSKVLASYVEVRSAEGATKYFALEANEVTIGKSPTAGVPLVNAAELLPEHLLVAPRRDGCWISVAAGSALPVLVADRPITGELVPWETEIKVGSLTLVVRRGIPPTPGLFSDGRPIAPDTPGERLLKISLRTLVAAVMLIAGYVLFFASDGDDLGPVGIPPELFPPLDAFECPPEGDPRKRAEDFAYEALARMDRYPFDSVEGILAIVAHTRAINCFQRIGARAEAHEERMRRDALQQKLEEDYRALTVQLERSLKEDDDRRSLQLVDDLLPMIYDFHRDHPYVQGMLRHRQRLVEAVLAAEKDG